MFGSAYADMRLVPYMMAVLLLAIRFRGATRRRLAQALAVLGLVLRRAAGVEYDQPRHGADDQQAKLEALDHVPWAPGS